MCIKMDQILIKGGNIQLKKIYLMFVTGYTVDGRATDCTLLSSAVFYMLQKVSLYK